MKTCRLKKGVQTHIHHCPPLTLRQFQPITSLHTTPEGSLSFSALRHLKVWNRFIMNEKTFSGLGMLLLFIVAWATCQLKTWWPFY